MKKTAFLYALAFGLAFIGTSGASAQASETMGQEGDAELYAECQRLLDSPPLNELHRHVSEGRGSEIDDKRAGESLIGVKCSDAQIIDYMEAHGFQYTGSTSWPMAQHSGGHGGYDFNKRLSFCTPRKFWLEKMFFGSNCAVGANFMLLDDIIGRIGAAGNK